jgi:beta-arrestin
VLVDPEYLKDRRVFGHVLAAFRYGREDLDVLGESLKQGCQICLGKTYQNW